MLKSTIEELLRRELQEILDDPAAATTSDVGFPIWVARLREVAEWLELNWDELLRELGSDFERARFTALLHTIERTKS